MIEITIPPNNTNERKYIIDIIFTEFLGLKYTLKIGSSEYEIKLNEKKLIIKDTFFNKFPNDLEYLSEENIPTTIKELDLFAACFFMLTRWEEYVNKTKDEHNRFPAFASLAHKEGFLNRPIVNELVEELKQQLLELDSNLIFKEKKFELLLTHDVDDVIFWKSKKQVLRLVLGDILKRKDFKLAYENLKDYCLVAMKKRKDPFDTFEWIMDKSEEKGLKSRFYFMSGGVTSHDNRYDIKTQKNLIEKIQKRGHIVGFHPSYNAYNDFKQLKHEKELLESVCKCKITEGREHYLRFEVPTTWQIWEDNGLKVDSTCGYADKEGFRCGTGDEFSVFNILTRKKLHLRERPLVFMDNHHYGYKSISSAESLRKIRFLVSQSIRFNTKITLLFHNSTFKESKIIDFYHLYNQLLEE